MKRTFLIAALVIGLAIGLSVAVGVAWYFIREQSARPTAASASSHAEPIEAAADGADSAVPGNNNARSAKFVEHDADHDGKLSLAEFSVGRKPAEAAKWFERRDVNHDGFISREEFLPFSAGQKAQ